MEQDQQAPQSQVLVDIETSTHSWKLGSPWDLRLLPERFPSLAPQKTTQALIPKEAQTVVVAAVAAAAKCAAALEAPLSSSVSVLSVAHCTNAAAAVVPAHSQERRLAVAGDTRHKRQEKRVLFVRVLQHP